MDPAPIVLDAAPIASLAEGNDHAVVDLPFTALIDGRQFRGQGLSLVRAHVVGLMGAQALAVPRLVKLVFDFSGFCVTLEALARVRDAQGGKGGIDLDFVQPSGPHLPQLRHILNAYIGRDLVSLGQIIAVAGTTPPKPAKPKSARAGRGYVQGAALAVLTVALIGVAAALIYQRSYVHLLPDLGIVTLQGETLRATASGQIGFLDTQAPMGQVALAITTSNGDVLSVTMPCDCAASSLGLRVGSTVLAGEPILQLATPNAPAVVLANIPPDLAFDVARGDRLELTLPDGSTVGATVGPNAGQTVSQSAGQPTALIPATTLAPALLGQPVRVRLIRESGWLGAFIATVSRWFNHVSGEL